MSGEESPSALIEHHPSGGQTSPSSSEMGPTRIPGTYPPEWLPDHETNSCMSCDSLFNLIKRRHHCRSCGKIFCSDCCRLKAKLLYLDNREARVCTNCFNLIELTLVNNQPAATPVIVTQHTNQNEQEPTTSSTTQSTQRPTTNKVQGVLKTSQSRLSLATSNESSVTQTAEQCSKQVTFSDGIRPGTDLSESVPYPIPSTSSTTSSPSILTTTAAVNSIVPTPFSLLTRQNRSTDGPLGGKKKSLRNITVCDELGYLPPIVINKNSPLYKSGEMVTSSSSSASFANLIASQFRSSEPKRTIQASMESRSCPLNGIINIEEISSLVGVNNVVTFLLLKDFYLKVKLTKKDCCIDKQTAKDVDELEDDGDDENLANPKGVKSYWCFTSDGIAKYGQSEVVLVLDKDPNDPCIPRDVFKIYLTLHELSLRRQLLENLGNLLFQDGLFGNRDTAGLLFVRPLPEHCLKNLVLPPESTPFLVALVLQRWEVPWSKVFPIRLLLRLGHKFDVYPYPIVSFRSREPVFYEVGHTIISILGDFRNFRYSITHVDGLQVTLNRATRKVLVKIHESSYQQFNKVLDNSNNEHVLAWSCSPVTGADGHLVSVQNEDGQYETVEFYKKARNQNVLFEDLESGPVFGASFVIFSGALKVNQSGQSAKISIVEDGLLIQIQSCTMSALRNAIHFMDHFDIDCESDQDVLNRVEIDWQ